MNTGVKMNSASLFKEIANPTAAWLYWHVCYWHERAGGLDFRGHHWVYGNYVSWERKTGMSYRQVQRSLVVLRQKGWVSTCQMAQGAGNVLLVRPLKSGKGLTGNGQEGWPEADNPVGLKEPTYSTEKPKTEIPYKELPQPPSGASEPEVHPFFPVSLPTPQKPPPSKIEDDMKTTHSVHDVPGMIAAKKKMHQPDSLAALAEVWQIGMKEHVPNKLIQLTVQDKGKLKHFVAHCEAGTGAAVLALVMANWIAYTKFCEQEAGAFKTPASPSLGFVVKFAQQAVTFFLQKQPKPDTKPELPALKPASAQLIAGQEPAPGLATMEDVLAPIDPHAALKGGSC